MRFCIHRGAEEIGGNCIQVESEGKSILLDLGSPLTTDWTVLDAIPRIPGLIDGSNPDLLGILISHPHADHYGLALHAHPSIPVYLGAEADKLLRAAAAFGPFGARFPKVAHYNDRTAFDIGPFRITPYLNDHSAFDAYAFLVQAEGKSLFYSGDLRGHGWKNWAFERLLQDGPKRIDVMLLEGTTMSRDKSEPIVSEADLVDPLAGSMTNTDGIVLAAFSGQNIDRFVTFYKAARMARRSFVVDLYIAHMLRAIDRRSLPDPTSNALRVYLPRRMKARIVREQQFDLVEPYRHRRIYPNELARRRKNLVMTFRGSMAWDLEGAGCLPGGRLVYSMWSGYLDRGSPDLRTWCGDNDLVFDIVHTSGHAHPSDLQGLVEAMKPKKLIPIHTVAPDLYEDFPATVSYQRDGVYVSV